MTDDEKLELLATDTAPRNADEFFLGMYLAYLADIIDSDDIPDDQELARMVDGAQKALVYWRNKYHEDILMAGGSNNDESVNGNGQS